MIAGVDTRRDYRDFIAASQAAYDVNVRSMTAMRIDFRTHREFHFTPCAREIAILATFRPSDHFIGDQRRSNEKSHSRI